MSIPDRFRFSDVHPWDFNGDGAFTISDVWRAWESLYYLPGDLIIWLLLDRVPPVAVFLEITSASYKGWLSGVLSGFLWVLGLLTIAAFVNALVETVRARNPRSETPPKENSD